MTEGWFNQLLQNEVKIKLKDLVSNLNESDRDDYNMVMIYDLLKKDIKKNGLSDKAKPITIDSTNKVMDGNHRINILYELYGPDYEVTVLKWPFPIWFFSMLITITEFVRWAFNKAKALYSKVG